MNQNEALQNPRVIVIQKLYGHHLNKDSEITFPKHRFKKFIKDVVNGTIERKDLIQNLMDKELKADINENKTLKVSDFFVEVSQKKYLNAILDKVSKVSRVNNE